jgi:L-amino acid N-acyltransferase YncA
MTERQLATFTPEYLQNVRVRPLQDDDRLGLLLFGSHLLDDDLPYLESDFQNPEFINLLINACAEDHWRQVVAVFEGEIVGYGAARLLHGRSNHVADVVLLVHKAWRDSGICQVLADAVFQAVRELNVAKVVAELISERASCADMLQSLGFQVEGLYRQHVRDRKGSRRDLLVLAYNVANSRQAQMAQMA